MARERQNISASGAAHHGVLVGQDGVVSRSLEKIPRSNHGGANIDPNSFNLQKGKGGAAGGQTQYRGS